MHFLEGPDLGHYKFIMRRERKVKEKKNQHGAGFEPTTSQVFALPLRHNRCLRLTVLFTTRSQRRLRPEEELRVDRTDRAAPRQRVQRRLLAELHRTRARALGALRWERNAPREFLYLLFQPLFFYIRRFSSIVRFFSPKLSLFRPRQPFFSSTSFTTNS